MQQGEREVAAALAKQWDGCVTNGLVRWYVTLNYGEEAAVRLCPSYVTEIEQTDDLREAAETLEKLVGMGLSVVESEVRERFGWRAPIEGEAVLEKAAAPAPAPPPVAEPDTEVEDPADEEDDAPEEDTEREET
jgi:phage gp29-like protein